MKFKFLEVTVRKNPSATIVSGMLPWQVPILKHLFGDDNVQATQSDAPATEVNVEAEYDRLCSCFGPEVVHEVYGHNKDRLTKEIVSYAEAEDKAKPKA